MTNNQIEIFSSVEELSDFFAREIKQETQKKKEGEFFNLSLSGGNTPKSIFQYITEHYSDQINWKKVQLFWGDERCVAPDDKESNYRMARQYLLDQVAIPSENIFRICGECDPAQAAKAYENTVRTNVPIKNSFPVFDLFMLGIGPEGHTASIFPDRLSLFQSEKWFDVATHPETGQKRITATGKVINNARKIFFLTVGEGKADILKKIMEKEAGWEKLPASKVQPTHGALIWLADDKAAKKLVNRLISE